MKLTAIEWCNAAALVALLASPVVLPDIAGLIWAVGGCYIIAGGIWQAITAPA